MPPTETPGWITSRVIQALAPSPRSSRAPAAEPRMPITRRGYRDRGVRSCTRPRSQPPGPLAPSWPTGSRPSTVAPPSRGPGGPGTRSTSASGSSPATGSGDEGGLSRPTDQSGRASWPRPRHVSLSSSAFLDQAIRTGPRRRYRGCAAAIPPSILQGGCGLTLMVGALTSCSHHQVARSRWSDDDLGLVSDDHPTRRAIHQYHVARAPSRRRHRLSHRCRRW